MLRSIFSLFQNIIDSDREYNNKKSSTVIYLVSSPVDHKINMDLEIDGKCRKTMKSVEAVETTQPSRYFTITTEQGDAVTCKHGTDNNIISKKQINQENKEATDTSTDEEVGDKPSFSYVNKESHIEDEKLETKSGETHGEVGINVRELLASLPLKKTPVLEKDKDQLGVLLDQIQKMKKGMERLHQIAKQFTCTDKFKQDVDLLMKNLSLQKPTDETTDNNKLSPSDP